MQQRQERIAYLDGLRGVAILLVVGWHYTADVYASYFSYGARYAVIPVLDHGWVGVNLFFLISGYVIFLTLEYCTGFGEFIRRRWLRLFPAMLLASLLVFAASQIFGAFMPHGRAAPINLLPGLTFVSPAFWQAILRRPVDELDGVYWTLYVEVGFYLTVGVLYFRLGWRWALAALATLWLAVAISSRLFNHLELDVASRWVAPLQWIGAEYFGWFVSGALFLKARETASSLLFAMAIMIGIVSSLTSDLWQPGDPVSRIYLLASVMFFAVAQRSAGLQRVLRSRLLQFAGAVSYPLYLLHNELGVGLIAIAGRLLPDGAASTLPLLGLLAMVLLAWIVTEFVEPGIRHLLRRAVA